MIRREKYEKLLKAKAPVWGPELNSELPARWLVRRAPDWLVFGTIVVALGLLGLIAVSVICQG